MADIHGVLGVGIKDSIGVKASQQQFVKAADTTTLAQIQTDVNTYLGKLDPVTDGVVSSVQLLLRLPFSGLKSSPTAFNEVGSGALFQFHQTVSDYKQSILVPAWAEALISSGHVVITGAAATWWDWFINGGVHLFSESKARNAMDAFLAGELVTRKHRKSETRVSFTPH